MKLTRYKAARARWHRIPASLRRAGIFPAILMYAAMFVLSDLLRPAPPGQNKKPKGLGDFDFPTATEGRVVPLIWGSVRVNGPNVVWYGDFEQKKVFQVSGLIFRKSFFVGWRYFLGMQMALCTGSSESIAERVTLHKVWIGDDLVGDFTATPKVHGDTFTIDKPNLFGGTKHGQGGVVGTMKFFSGTKDQLASTYFSGSSVLKLGTTIQNGGTGYSVFDTLTEAGDGTATIRATFRVMGVNIGTGAVTSIRRLVRGEYSIISTNPAATTGGAGTGCTLNVAWSSQLQQESGVTPAYRDITYVIPDTDNVELGMSTSIKPWNFALQRIPNGLALGSGHEIVAQGANPMNVIYEVLTNADWGYGVPAVDVDIVGFTAAAATLFSEGNGFSFILDSPIDIQEIVAQIEEQIDGVLFVDPITAKWKIKLIRDDFDIDLVPEVTATSMLEMRTFTRSTWEGTTNQVRVEFNDQDDDYKKTFGFAQDMANVLILGKPVSTTIKFPGVKDRTLANSLAWRELRALTTPLSQATIVVDRSFYGLLPGDPFAFTDADVGVSKLPMRVKDIDYGRLLDGKITIQAVQDAFKTAVGVFDDPPASGWQPPSGGLVAYPSFEQLIFEAPRAFTSRAEDILDPSADVVYANARRQGGEGSFEIRERHSPVVPTGAFSAIGDVFQFQLMGELLSPLNLGPLNPVSSVIIVPQPDTQSAIDAEIPTSLNLAELGTSLMSLCMIDEEFILIGSSQVSGPNVQLNSVYRGLLDSVQADHAAGASVFLIFAGGDLSTGALPAGDNVEVKLIPQSLAGELPEAEATVATLTMDNRTRRPYPPSSFQINSTVLDTTNVDLAGSGTGENVGVLIDAVIRRDFRTIDEIAAALADASTIFSDFPAANSTEIDVFCLNGATALTSVLAVTGTSATLRQLDILASLDTTPLPASLTFAVRQSHTFESVVYKSRVLLQVTSTLSSPLIGKHAWGQLSFNIASSSDFTVVADTVDHVFALSTSFAVGDVQYELNGSAIWVSLITAGNTTGTILAAALTNTDTIAIRHLSTDASAQKLLTMTVSATAEAYAVLIS